MEFKRPDKDFWIFSLKALIIAILVTGFCVFLVYNSAIAIALAPWATLLLAFAAFWAIWQNYSLHKRARKENLLNEIIKWAEDVASLNFKIYNLVESQIAKESWVKHSLGEIVSQFQVVEAKGDYVNNIAKSSFKKDKKLGRAIRAMNKELRELVDASVKRLDKKIASEEVTDHMDLLRIKTTNLLKEAAKIKARDTN